ncbi:MAG: acetyltransferase [Microbacteriaceae bacterium]|jgi:peptidoglycan/LPS O-acetylase OafA/YrhL|nr:acetyltransferase [Microbacteriaceae bacterium]
MTSPTQPRAAHLSGPDGLRAIAVAAVILYHLSPGALPGGFLGVDIFFVISGFLITGLLLRERTETGRIRLGAFWARRARRLLPALVVLLMVCSSAALLLGGDVLVHLGRQLLGAATFSSNWLSIAAGQSYFDSTTPDLFRNLWSLAVEEQFYLVWPFAVLLLALVRSHRARVIIVAALAVLSAVAMVMLYVPGGDATRVYYGTDTHAFGLAIGAALALALSRRSLGHRWLTVLGVVALAAVLATTALLPDSSPITYQGGLVGVGLLTAVVIAAAVGSRLGRVLDVAPLRWVGARSYGLYLWHWPVFVLVVAALPTWQRTGAGGWELGGIALAITVAAATLSYRFVEQPIRRDGFAATWHRWTRAWGSGAARAVGAVAVAILLLAGVLATTGAVLRDPGVSSAQAAIEAGAKAITPAPATTSAAPAVPGAGTPTPAAPPPLPGGDQISAIGDSVMLASAPELEAAFPGIDINAVVSRQASTAPGIVQGMIDAGTLRQTLLIGLGTNGPIDPSILEKLHSMIGPRHQIVVVNVEAPRGWVDGVNSELSHFAQEYRNVELANWQDAISGKLDLLARDQIHPGQSGGLVYVQAVTEALQRLAELPPTLGPNDYGLAPVPL